MQTGSFDEAPLLSEAESIGVPQPIAPDLWRIVLPLPFTLASMNAYVLHGADEWCLIDCGLGTRKSDAALVKGLAELGIAFADLDALVLTHSHPDHIGPMGDIAAQMRPDARVIMLDLEAAILYQVWEPTIAEQAQRALFDLRCAGGLAPEVAEKGMQSMLSMGRIVRLAPPDRVTHTHDGEILTLAGQAWQVIWTPGHAEGHMCLVNGDRVILGDHILPRISPNLSLYPRSHPDPIQDYEDSLDRITALELAAPLALPGHGHPFAALATRIQELHASTTRRSQKMLAALRAQTTSVTPLDVAETIFQGRLNAPEDRWMALGETQAHLEHLRLQGLAARAERAGVAYYQAL